MLSFWTCTIKIYHLMLIIDHAKWLIWLTLALVLFHVELNSQIRLRFRFRPDLSSQIRPDPARSDLEKWNPVQWLVSWKTAKMKNWDVIVRGEKIKAKERRQEAQLPQRDSASATHVFLGSLTDCALHWTPHLLYNYNNSRTVVSTLSANKPCNIRGRWSFQT